MLFQVAHRGQGFSTYRHQSLQGPGHPVHFSACCCHEVLHNFWAVLCPWCTEPTAALNPSTFDCEVPFSISEETPMVWKAPASQGWKTLKLSDSRGGSFGVCWQSLNWKSEFELKNSSCHPQQPNKNQRHIQCLLKKISSEHLVQQCTNKVTWRLCPTVPTLTIPLQGAPARWNMAGKVLLPFMTIVLLNLTDTNRQTGHMCVQLVTIPKLNSSQMWALYICIFFFFSSRF